MVELAIAAVVMVLAVAAETLHAAPRVTWRDWRLVPRPVRALGRLAPLLRVAASVP